MKKEGRYIFCFRAIDSKEVLFEFEVSNLSDEFPTEEFVDFKYAWISRQKFEENLSFLRNELKMVDDGERYTPLYDMNFRLKKKHPEKNIELIIKPVNRVLQIWKSQIWNAKEFYEYKLIEVVFDDDSNFISTNLNIEKAHLLVEKIEEYSNEQEYSAKYRIESLGRESARIYDEYLKEQKKKKDEEKRLEISERIKNGEELYSVFIVWYDYEVFHDVIIKKYNQDGLLTWSNALSEDAYDYRHVFGPDTLEKCRIEKSEQLSIWGSFNSDESDRRKSYGRYEDEGRNYSWLKGD